jgi:mannosyltransferase OCH1-like enzyme
MISKIIHYCWFGKNNKEAKIIKCINTWKQYCPDYEIIEWNEENFDVNNFEYTKKAYENKCWSKVSNFVRIWCLYYYGGIYLDTDMILFKNIDPLLNNDCFFGIEYRKNFPFYKEDFAQTLFGTAIIGAIKNHETIKRILEHYKNKEWSDFERTVQSNNVLLLTNLFNEDILNNCTIYSKQILYPDNRTDESFCQHLKFDSWGINRIS